MSPILVGLGKDVFFSEQSCPCWSDLRWRQHRSSHGWLLHFRARHAKAPQLQFVDVLFSKKLFFCCLRNKNLELVNPRDLKPRLLLSESSLATSHTTTLNLNQTQLCFLWSENQMSLNFIGLSCSQNLDMAHGPHALSPHARRVGGVF